MDARDIQESTGDEEMQVIINALHFYDDDEPVQSNCLILRSLPAILCQLGADSNNSDYRICRQDTLSMVHIKIRILISYIM